MRRFNLLLVLIVYCSVVALLSGCIRAQQVSRESELKAKLYVEAMKNVLITAGGPKEFIAVKLDTLEGLSDKQKRWIIKQMQTYTKNIYSYDEVKNDPSKFYFQNRDRTGTKNGVVLSVKLIRFEKNQAELEAAAWHGNLGMDSITYTAKYENGSWTLKIETISKA